MKRDILKLFIIGALFFLHKINAVETYEYDFENMELNLDLLDDNLDDFDASNFKDADSDIFDALIDFVSSINEPLWNQTKPPKGRDTLYLMPHRMTAIEYGGLAINSFFNYTDKMNFSVDEILKLEANQSALEALVDGLIDGLDSDQASALIPLFRGITIQERKIGTLFQLSGIFQSFRLEIDSSIQLSERNFWLSQKDQDAISAMFTDSDSDFNTDELYKMKLGLGDTRIKLGLNTLNTPTIQLDLGFESIIPSSEISISKQDSFSDIDLENLEDDLSKILIAIRDNLITPQLGNYGHYGIGVFAESKISLFEESLQIWNRLSIDNLFSAHEVRLIPSKKTIIDVDLAELTINEIYASKFIKEYIFPPAYSVDIIPGSIVNFISTFNFKIRNKVNVIAGYDYYHQRAERIKSVDGVSNLNLLNIEAAVSKQASQHKIFIEFNKAKKNCSKKPMFSIGGDYTILSDNIGHDWTLFLRIAFAF